MTPASPPVQTDARRPRIKPGTSLFRWGSHRPVLQGLIDLARPGVALELGMGDSSTPFLHARVPTLVSIENNAEWFGQMLSRVPAREGFHPRCHRLYTAGGDGAEELHYAVTERDAPEFSLRAAGDQYRALAREFGRFDLVLVDQYASCRRLSLEILAPHADVLVLHDSDECVLAPEDPQHDVYGYNRFIASAAGAGFAHYRVDVIKYWTDVLVRPGCTIDPKALSARINDHFREYVRQTPPPPGEKPRFRDSYLLRAPRPGQV